jgi:hypothetical protein
MQVTNLPANLLRLEGELIAVVSGSIGKEQKLVLTCSAGKHVEYRGHELILSRDFAEVIPNYLLFQCKQAELLGARIFDATDCEVQVSRSTIIVKLPDVEQTFDENGFQLFFELSSARMLARRLIDELASYSIRKHYGDGGHAKMA